MLLGSRLRKEAEVEDDKEANGDQRSGCSVEGTPLVLLNGDNVDQVALRGGSGEHHNRVDVEVKKQVTLETLGMSRRCPANLSPLRAAGPPANDEC